MSLGDSNWLQLWANGIYEPWTTELVKTELLPGDIFVDVGANIGYFTLIASKLVGESGHVYAFEPNPSSFAILKRNVEENGLHNVTIEQKAVTNLSGREEFWSDKGNSYAWKKERARTAFSADCVSLDEYFQGRHIDLMKMDIDGGETKALEGGSKTLSTGLEKLIIEFWPMGFNKQNIDPGAFLNTLASLGFDFHASSFLPSFRQTECRRLLEAYAADRHSYYDSVNIFCVKR